jgi:hypothetical protein
VLTSNDKGNIAEAAIALEAIKLGIDVLKPVAEHGRYGLLFDLGERLVRVQCKWGSLDRRLGVICVRVGGSRYTPNGYVTNTYSADEIDAVAVYCGDLGENIPDSDRGSSRKEAIAPVSRGAAERPARLH